jgi:hypothetical protein
MCKATVCLILQLPFLIQDVRDVLWYIHIEDAWIIVLVALWMAIGAYNDLRSQSDEISQRQRRAAWATQPVHLARQR